MDLGASFRPHMTHSHFRRSHAPEDGDWVEFNMSVAELHALAWRRSLDSLAKVLGLSGNGLLKRMRRLGIPVPPRGHWAQSYAGKAVIQRPLPMNVNPARKVTFLVHNSKAQDLEKERTSVNLKAIPSTHPLVAREFESTWHISVPHRSSRGVEWITATRQYLVRQHADHNGCVQAKPGLADVCVHRTSVPRALQIVTALNRAAEVRRFSIRLKPNGTYLRIYGQERSLSRSGRTLVKLR